VKLYPEILFKATSNNKPVGAFRVWFIAKDFDHGTGFIPAKRFRQHLADLGIARPTFYRWLSQAFELGLLSHYRTNRGAKVYSLTSWERGAALAGVSSLLRPVNIEVERFISKGWLAVVWGAYIKHFEGKNIARATLHKLTGVPARTQRGYEKQIEVKSKGHFANFGDPTKDPQNAVSIDERRGIYGKAGMTRRRLPDSRTVEEENIELANKGRTKKANRALKALLLTRCSSQKPEKLYFETYQKLKRATRGKQRDGNAKDRPNHRYLFITDALGVGVWEAINA
jgi:hypothetical protein